MIDLLKDFPAVSEIPVAWGDMDAFKHVNNVNYIKYFESSRIKYFELIDYLSLIELGIGPILASISCKYKAPVTYPDTLLVGCKVSKLSEDRFINKYIIYSKKLNIITTEGEGVIVSYNYNENKKIPFPEQIINNIIKIEKNLVL
ncbi:MAG: acyl-CoA thioesterase [Candidatus Sericytochromatia bacterium]|nr:acyl-CoA thioesterase [Candidatus Sericytochromatia bacterium]